MSKRKTKNKVVLLRRAKKLADSLWSTYIRRRDGKCLLCSSKDKLQAHHCLIRKALSNHTRWNINNGVTLCYRCHLIEIHGNATKSVLENYLKIINEMYSAEQQCEVISKSKSTELIDLSALNNIISDLKNRISLLDKKSKI